MNPWELNYNQEGDTQEQPALNGAMPWDAEYTQPQPQGKPEGFAERLGARYQELSQRDAQIAADTKAGLYGKGRGRMAAHYIGNVGVPLAYSPVEAGMGAAYDVNPELFNKVGAGALKAAEAVHGQLPDVTQQGIKTIKDFVQRRAVRGVEEYGKLDSLRQRDINAATNIAFAAPLFGLAGRGAEAGLKAGVPALAKGAKKGIQIADTALGKTYKIPTTETVKGMANTAYEEAKKAGLKIDSGFVGEFVKRSNQKLKQSSLALAASGEKPKPMKILEGMYKNYIEKQKAGRGLSFNDLQKTESVLSAAKKAAVNLDGSFTPDGLALKVMLDDWRKMLYGKAGEKYIQGSKRALEYQRRGTKLWPQYKLMKKVDGWLEHAANTKNPAQSISSQAAAFLNPNKKQSAWIDDSVREALTTVARTGAVSDIIQLLGYRLNTTLGNAALIGGGFAAGGVPAAIGAYAIPAAARGLAHSIKKKDAAKALKVIAAKGGVKPIHKPLSRRVKEGSSNMLEKVLNTNKGK